MQHFLAQQQQQQQQQQYGDWPAQAQAQAHGHHQQPQHHVGQHGQHQAQAAQLHAQQQAQAVQAAAQRQYHQQLAANNGTTLPGNNAVPRGPANDAQASDIGMTEENRRVLEWIAQLMKPATREAALLELSKKREQVPELALILWHSFGTSIA
jgi:CCR4-NOT transcription complex subunit 9